MTIQRRMKLYYGTKTIDYLLVKSKRVKTSEIIVEKNKVIIRTPFDKPLYKMENIIQTKAHWILKKRVEYKEKPSQILRPTFKPYRSSLKVMIIFSFYILRTSFQLVISQLLFKALL